VKTAYMGFSPAHGVSDVYVSEVQYEQSVILSLVPGNWLEV